MAYKIGEKVWHAGEQLTITSEPIELYGGLWQDSVNRFGKVCTLPAPESREADTKRRDEADRQQREAFARLHNR